jgi:hypothetical protein
LQSFPVRCSKSTPALQAASQPDVGGQPLDPKPVDLLGPPSRVGIGC